VLWAVLLAQAPAHAVEPDEILNDPALEAPAMLRNAEVDEPDSTAVPTWPHTQASVLLRDDPSKDTVVDVMTEEQLLKGMEKFAPMDSSVSIGNGP
jgi:hypothetical protein